MPKEETLAERAKYLDKANGKSKKSKQELVDNGNGHATERPEIMTGAGMPEMVRELKDVFRGNNSQIEMSKYLAMEGMQDYDKVSFFTEYTNFDDVLRMNTIEMFRQLAPTMVKKTSEKNLARIKNLLDAVYGVHITTHKVNMTSIGRKREKAYVDILRNDGGEQINNSLSNRLFGIKGAPAQK